MTSIECQPQIYKVSLQGDENDSLEYIIRGLDDDEIRGWSEFCASVFSYKKNPPPADYFHRHYANDPTTQLPGSSKLIRAALFQGTIVASCRIFLKEIASGPSTPTLLSGGIGEVCTHVQHRRRGISKRLLQNAIAILQERNVQVSSLHAAPTFFPLYESLGYSAPPVSNPSGANRWSIVNCCWKPNCGEGTKDNSDVRIRPAEFPSDTQSLQKLHARYSEKRLVGCIVRSKEYWNNYLSKELEGSLFVLVSKDGNILSWLSLAIQQDLVCLEEFGMDVSVVQPQNESLGMNQIVEKLIVHAIEEQVALPNTNDTVTRSIKLPGFVSDELRSCQDSKTNTSVSFFDWESERTEMDRGWMYRGVGNSGAAAIRDFLDFLHGTVTTPSDGCNNPQLQPKEHFVWPSDSF